MMLGVRAPASRPTGISSLLFRKEPVRRQSQPEQGLYKAAIAKGEVIFDGVAFASSPSQHHRACSTITSDIHRDSRDLQCEKNVHMRIRRFTFLQYIPVWNALPLVHELREKTFTVRVNNPNISTQSWFTTHTVSLHSNTRPQQANR